MRYITKQVTSFSLVTLLLFSILFIQFALAAVYSGNSTEIIPISEVIRVNKFTPTSESITVIETVSAFIFRFNQRGLSEPLPLNDALIARKFTPTLEAIPIAEAVTVTVFRYMPHPPLYTPQQEAAIQLAKNVCGTIDETGIVDIACICSAMQSLIQNGLVDEPSFSFDPATAKSYLMILEELYGENLERFPTVEGRIWLLYMLKVS